MSCVWTVGVIVVSRGFVRRRRIGICFLWLQDSGGRMGEGWGLRNTRFGELRAGTVE